MNLKQEWKKLIVITAVFGALFYLPVDSERLQNAVLEALHLAHYYAREHVILCLIPAFFIAGAIAAFVKQESVIKYLGAGANKVLAYGVASVSGTILAVCSCTILPLFSGIYRMGAGLGPATAFLYSGPAINVLAIVLTARVLGWQLGVARAVGAIIFSIFIGLCMHIIFIKEEREKAGRQNAVPAAEVERPLYQNALYFASMVGVLVFANWGAPEVSEGFWAAVHGAKWWLTGLWAILLAVILVVWFGQKWWKLAAGGALTLASALLIPHQPMIPFMTGAVALSVTIGTEDGEGRDWLEQTWDFAKQILPLLFIGVLIAGLLLGRPGNEGVIPSQWVESMVGGNSFQANVFAAVAGAFMYFATLTEIPILEGLIGAGMGEGPSLALLLAGPALSLPNMLVIRSVIGTKKTLVYLILVVASATASGMLYGTVFA